MAVQSSLKFEPGGPGGECPPVFGELQTELHGRRRFRKYTHTRPLHSLGLACLPFLPSLSLYEVVQICWKPGACCAMPRRGFSRSQRSHDDCSRREKQQHEIQLPPSPRPQSINAHHQLSGETHACAMGDVYTFGPTFRAENSQTARHLAEFWMIEPEMSFADLRDDMDNAVRETLAADLHLSVRPAEFFCLCRCSTLLCVVTLCLWI